MITVQIDDKATPHLRELIKRAGGAPGLLAAGRGVAEALRRHFAAQEATRPNKWTGRRKHFWSRVRSSVQNPKAEGPQVRVSINHEAIGQKVRGGIIRPVRKKWLTIPACAEAYGLSAKDFDLQFVKLSGKPALVTKDPRADQINKRTGRLKAGVAEGGKVMFWLRKLVRQRPDPRALPPESQMVAAAVAAIEDYVHKQEARQGTNKP